MGCQTGDSVTRAAVNLQGKRFGRLIAVRRQGSQRSYATWFCQCDCGQTAIVIGSSLLHRRTNSCGCLRRETYVANMTRRKPAPTLNGVKQLSADEIIAKTFKADPHEILKRLGIVGMKTVQGRAC